MELEPFQKVTWPLAPEPVGPLPTHVPLMAKHPPASSIPRAKVEVAAVPVIFKYAAFTPAVKVEVAEPETVRVFPTLNEPVEVPLPVSKLVANRFVLEAVVAKILVVVALVEVD